MKAYFNWIYNEGKIPKYRELGSYHYEAIRRLPRCKPKMIPFKSRGVKLKEYIETHELIVRDDIQKMSFTSPTAALKRYTAKSGQTFIQQDYDTWTKGEKIEPTLVHKNRPKKCKLDWKEKYPCTVCKELIIKRKNYVQSKTGRCKSCAQKQRNEKKPIKKSK